MREIRFRALVKHRETKEIYWEYYETFDQPTWLDFYDIIVKDLQFTGLLDKKGREIFEGDIVKHNDYGQISVVTWSQTDWGWLMKYAKNWNPKTQFDSSRDEVIGNIYENPELLDKKEEVEGK